MASMVEKGHEHGGTWWDKVGHRNKKTLMDQLGPS